jgi:protocatechuate 3,4-dioxygenase beta subunit
MNNKASRINRILTRRETLALIRVAGGALFVTCLPRQLGSVAQEAATTRTLPACTVRPQQTEGPYFVDEKLNRSDIRSNPADGVVKAGKPLSLRFRVSAVSGNSCQPIKGAIVDIWHCDALGVYSDVADPRFNTVGQKFLRGYQVTNANGTVNFLTVYPGWYQGRTTHIHFKIRTNSTSGKTYEFTSQLYFDDVVTEQVYAQQPYASKGQRTFKNAQDGIFRSGGQQLLLTLTSVGQGYAATFDIGLQVV